MLAYRNANAPTKPTITLVRSTKNLIRLRRCAVWSESSRKACAYYSLRAIQSGISENLCNTGWMYSLIFVFASHTGHIVGSVVRCLIYYFAGTMSLESLCLRPSCWRRRKEECQNYHCWCLTEKASNFFMRYWWKQVSTGPIPVF